ncbi:MAG: hypothetical protein DRI65_08515 [Chloroflexota bacterium]|nr:MAG: hypothetical protein DRI65_08515 [Chloroflexota bacterium]
MGSNKKGSGSFCIPRKAIEKLLQTGEQAKWLIPSYLKLAAHTDVTGLYSTAGHSSIRSTLKRNKDDAIRFASELCKMKLIYTAAQWEKKVGKAFPDDVPERQKVRFVLNDFKEDRTDMVWFSRGLIDGVGEFLNPLRRLADCGGAGARMFLYLYSEYDIHSFHACNPLSTIYTGYTPVGQQWSTNYMIKEWLSAGMSMTTPVRVKVFPDVRGWEQLRKNAEWQDAEAHWEAVSNLEAAGFIYESVAVVSSPVKVKSKETEWDYSSGEAIPEHLKKWDYADMENMAVVYELANKDRFASDTGELHEAIKNTLSDRGVDLQPSNVYSILPTGSNNSVIGLYKPRFVPDNTRNAHVAEGINNRREDKDQAMRWVKHFNTTKGLDKNEYN